jgi:SOS-response transcriptional repressor LexA
MSARAEAVLRYLKAHTASPPTIREIKAGCGISSTSLVAAALDELALAGQITMQRGVSRSVRLAGHVDEVDRLKGEVVRLLTENVKLRRQLAAIEAAR